MNESTHEQPTAPEPGTSKPTLFVTTRWTLVQSAGNKSSPEAQQALEELCRAYWFPLYAYVRRKGHSREDAEDLTQAFFARFLEKNYLEDLRAESGRFRSFLLACLKNFLANEWDKATRQKRGGGARLLSLDCDAAEQRISVQPADIASPDCAYDREWALALLQRVVERLRAECAADGRGALFEQLKGYLMLGEEATPYAQAAKALGVNESAARVAVHRLRHQFRDLLHGEVADTLADPAQVAVEISALRAALAR